MSKPGFVNIKGKEYETVASRVSRFREKYPDYRLLTKIIQLDGEICIVEATVYKDSVPVANGHAQEFRKSSQINSTSYVENCETSAIGRALACFGIGGTEYASADEVVRAIDIQSSMKAQALKQSLAPAQDILNGADTVPESPYDPLTDQQQAEAESVAKDLIALDEVKLYEDAAFKFYKLENAMRVAVWAILKPNPGVRRNISQRKPVPVPDPAGEYVPGAE